MNHWLHIKHNLPEYIKKHHKKNLRRGSLKLAFIEKRYELAKTIKEKYPSLSFIDWFWYLGVKYNTIRMLLITIKKISGDEV